MQTANRYSRTISQSVRTLFAVLFIWSCDGSDQTATSQVTFSVPGMGTRLKLK